MVLDVFKIEITGTASFMAAGEKERQRVELEIAVMPDEDGEGMYEAVETDLQDATVKTKWMEEFSRELVELNA